MASSGHFSSVVSIEAVSSAAAGELRSEVPLLASQEGTECFRRGLDHVSLRNVPRVTFAAGFTFHCFLFDYPESSGLSFQLASLDETGVLNFWVGKATLSSTEHAGHPL